MEKKLTPKQYEEKLAGYAELITKLGQENKMLKQKQVSFDKEWYMETLRDIQMLAYTGLENIGEYDVVIRALFRSIETNCAVAMTFVDDNDSYLETIDASPY